MAGSKVLSASEAARAAVTPLGGGVYYGARKGTDGKYRMGQYTFGNQGRSGSGFHPRERKFVPQSDGG